MQLISKTDNRPYMNVIFGNFYSPAFDNEEFVDKTMGLIRDLGFNSVMFDTKAWEDFKERFETGALSQYVKMQEYMGGSAHRHGLAYNFLLLYLNGDNLYPHIRFSPPIFGEETVYLDGRPGRWYKYWSEKAQISMKEHVDRIMKQYGQGCERCLTGEIDQGKDRQDMNNGAREVIPVCSMWDPVVAPSFDKEGQKRYLDYLRELYQGDIKSLNHNYETELEKFDDLTPKEYWYSVRFGSDSFYTEEDVKKCSPKFWVWRDNALWKIHELTLYFEKIGPMLKENNPELLLCPDMSQWGYFLNIYGMNGLDDGGVMNRMDTHFLDSLRMANEWFSQVICLRKGEKKKEIAILFPSEMAHLEPYEVGNNKIRRLDLLGWYKLCCDLGYQVDVISNHEIEKGTLAEYKVLIVPSNNCYFAVDHAAMEKEIRSWVCKGGVLLHGPGDLLAENCFGIQGEECEKKPYHYGKTIIAQGEAFCRYQDGKEIASYVDHGGCCVAKYEELELAQKMNTKYRPGMGAVYSFGIQIGASYAAKNIPHVPYEQGNKEMYPIIQSGTTLVKDILYHYMTPVSGICERGIETGVFENGMVVVNHRSIPYVLPEKYKIEKYQYSFHAVQNGNGILAGHEAVWVSNDTTGDDYGENKIK